jgi:hypothetical protein
VNKEAVALGCWAIFASLIPLVVCFQEIAGVLALVGAIGSFAAFASYVASGGGWRKPSMLSWGGLVFVVIWSLLVGLPAFLCYLLSECAAPPSGAGRWLLGILGMSASSALIIQRVKRLRAKA